MAITLVWQATETVTAEQGGDTLNTSLNFLQINGAETETYNKSAEIASHAVERGVDITDHVRPGNLGVRFECRVSQDVEETRDKLNTLIDSGQLVDIETDVGEYLDMILTALSEPRSHRSGDALFFTLEAQQIRLVDVVETEAPAPVIERARRRTNRGRESTGKRTTDDEIESSAATRELAMSVLRGLISRKKK